MSVITWWILFVVFGIFSIDGLIRYFHPRGTTRYQVVLMVVSIIIAAVSAGMIWG
jgi:hypothetical protein